MSKNVDEILSRDQENYEEQNKVLQSSRIIIIIIIALILLHSIIITFPIKACSRNAIRRKFGSNWELIRLPVWKEYHSK